MDDFSVEYTIERYPFDLELAENCYNTIEWVRKARKELAEELNKKYDARAKIDLKWIADFAVDNFYDSRTPLVYKRTESLYKAYDIVVEEGYWDIETKPDNMGAHHQSNVLIFNNVFLQGFHGGSAGTDKNGDTAMSPAWRTPVPKYTHWGANAAQASESPEDEIYRELVKYATERTRQKQIDFEEGEEKIFDKLYKAMDALLGSVQK